MKTSPYIGVLRCTDRWFGVGLAAVLTALSPVAMAGAAEASRGDPLLALGCLDVPRPPYSADPTGKTDCTVARQRAIEDARDRGLVCFFPTGTCLISNMLRRCGTAPMSGLPGFARDAVGQPT